MIYKEKLAGSTQNLWKQQRTMNSNHTQSIENSTILTMDGSKISDLETTLSNLIESQLQHTSDHQ